MHTYQVSTPSNNIATGSNTCYDASIVTGIHVMKSNAHKYTLYNFITQVLTACLCEEAETPCTSVWETSS